MHVPNNSTLCILGNRNTVHHIFQTLLSLGVLPWHFLLHHPSVSRFTSSPSFLLSVLHWLDCKTSSFAAPISVQFSHSILSDSLWPMDCSMPGIPVLHQILTLLKLMSIKSVRPSNNLILCRPLFLLSSIFFSIRDFSSDSVLHIRCPMYWSFSFSISPSNEYSGLISFRMDWFDILAVQGALKSLL